MKQTYLLSTLLITSLISMNMISCSEVKRETKVQQFKVVNTLYEAAKSPSSSGINLQGGELTIGSVDLNSGRYEPLSVPITTHERYLVYLINNEKMYMMDSKYLYDKAIAGQTDFDLYVTQIYVGQTLWDEYVSPFLHSKR